MKKALSIVFNIVLLGNMFAVRAQIRDANLEKYNYYREQLKEKFMYYTGNAAVQGSHLPAEIIRENSDHTTTAYWADATWWQGHYIAMLAIEYKLLQLQGVSTDEALDELRLAIATLYRLDAHAEHFWKGKDTINGFFLRDDITYDMDSVMHVNTIASDYARLLEDTTTTGNAPSQDQIWACYLGFSLVVKLVDDEEIRNQVRDLTRKFVGIMQHTTEEGKQKWEIVNPVTGSVIQKSGDIKWLRYIHAKAASQITGEDMNFANSDSKVWKTVWNTIQNNCLINKKGNFVWYGVFCCSLVANEWGRGADNSYDWLQKRCAQIVKKRPDLQQTLIFPHLPLIAVILYGYDGNKAFPASVYETYFNAAPEKGAFRINKSDGERVSDAPWHSLSLFCPWHTKSVGYFNMLDYMLLYNAYRLVYKSNISEFQMFE